MNLVAVIEIVDHLDLLHPAVRPGRRSRSATTSPGSSSTTRRSSPSARCCCSTIWWQVSAKKWFTGPEAHHRPGRRRGLRRADRPDVDDADLDRLAILAGRSWRVTDLPGGLTNHNVRVVTDDDGPPLDVVVRCSSSDAGLLGIDRDAEHANTAAAAEAGVGAAGGRVPARPRRCWSSASCRAAPSRTPTSPTPACWPGPPTPAGGCTPGRGSSATSTCSPGRRLPARPCASSGFALPATYDDHADAWADVRRALAAAPAADRAVQQRPAGRQLHRRRRAGLADRLRVLRQQRRLLRARQHLDRVRLHRRSRPRPGPRRTSATRPRPTWRGSGCRRCAASTAGRCGASSRPPPARSTSTSTAGGWSASRRPRRPSAARTSRGCSSEVAPSG